MSTNRHINKICAAAIVLSLVLTLLFMGSVSLGTVAAGRTMGYENRLFDTSSVHTIDIVIDDWDGFIETCENEEYSPCAVVIDGERYSNIGIRAKGNTSLSSVRSMGSRRYSFKLEFDQYETGKTYYGLDKLSLNNLIQDNTMMKDYLVYRMMGDFGVDAPLCSYVYITVNGEDWGLYLAVEGVEDGFLQRNYGSDSGELYKPDSMSFGGGEPGNGRDFNFDALDFSDMDSWNMQQDNPGSGGDPAGAGQGMDGSRLQAPGGGTFPGGFGRMESDDVKLKYIDDDADSYSNIFNNAKTRVTDTDKQRLIAALKKLGEYSDLESTVDTEEVMRYFVVHNFVCNGDSYTGAMIHNYYLHEQDGQLSMIPWDYNLAFGTFEGGNADSSVNASIDNPVSGGSVDDRPMLGWIFSKEGYTQKYHELFSELTDRWFSDGQLAELIGETQALIMPFVEKDPTKFCTAEEFETGVQALETFVSLRAEAVSRQLSGDTSMVDATGLDISDMGTMGGAMGGGFGGRSDNASRVDDSGADAGNADSAEARFPQSGGQPFSGEGGFPFAEDGQNGEHGGTFPESPGEDGNRTFKDFPGAQPGGMAPWENVGSGTAGEYSTHSAGILLAASAIVLLAGLFVAIKVRHI